MYGVLGLGFLGFRVFGLGFAIFWIRLCNPLFLDKLAALPLQRFRAVSVSETLEWAH